MSTIPLPALQIKQPPDLLSEYAKVQDIMGQRQEQQARGLQIQQAQLSLQDQQAQTKAMQAWDGKDYNDLPTLVKQNGGSMRAVLDTSQKILQRQQSVSEIAKNDAATGASNLEQTIKKHDEYRGRIQAIIDAPADQKQALWAQEIAAEKAAGTKMG